MNRKEAKRKRTALVIKERQLVTQYCKPCPNANADVDACKLCTTYVKLGELGKAIDDVTVAYRLANNLKTFGMSAQEFEKRGRYNDFKDIAEQHGVSRVLFNVRTKNGMPALEAATTPPRQHKTLTDEQAEIAKKNGIPRKYVTTRLNSGWSMEDAITTPVENRGLSK